jgi:uncharacterized protein (DUF2267 family)
MTPNFNKYAQKSNLFLKEVANELQMPDDPGRALRILRAVLHGLRDRIPPQESLQMISQLPMYIKAIYVEGWKWSPNNNSIRHIDDFVATVKSNDGVSGDYDFEDAEHTEEYIKGVFRVLQRHVSEGEIADVVATLPTDLRPLFV